MDHDADVTEHVVEYGEGLSCLLDIYLHDLLWRVRMGVKGRLACVRSGVRKIEQNSNSTQGVNKRMRDVRWMPGHLYVLQSDGNRGTVNQPSLL